MDCHLILVFNLKLTLLSFYILTFNLVMGFLLFLLFLALRQHRRGYNKVWLYPVPIYPWFGTATSSPKRSNTRKTGLPAPVTARDTRRATSTRRPSEKVADYGKPEQRKSAFWVWVEKPREAPREVPTAHTRDRRRENSRRTAPTRR